MAGQLRMMGRAERGPGSSVAPSGAARRRHSGGSPVVAGAEPGTAGPVRRDPPILSDVLASPGRPLDFATRAFFEPRFGADLSRVPSGSGAPVPARAAVGETGDHFEREADATADRVAHARLPQDGGRHDFGDVRVHADARAAECARQMNAHALTLGRHIVFDAGEYSPHSPRGRELLAHELTHVVQQTRAASGGPANPAPAVRQRLAQPRIQGKWRLDRVAVDEGQVSSDKDGNATVITTPFGRDATTWAGVTGSVRTWQEQGVVHQQVGGRGQLAYWIRKQYIFRNDGRDADFLQLRPVGQLSGNAKAEDLRYARAGAAIWGRIIQRTTENPTPGDRELFPPIKDGGISAATVGDLGVIEVDVRLGERGSARVTIPLKKVDEGTFVPFNEATTPVVEVPSDIDEVEVFLGGMIEADAEIETAFFGVSPLISQNVNSSNATTLINLAWESRAAPAPRPGAAGVQPGPAGGPTGAAGGRPDLFRDGNASGPRIDRVRVPPHPKPDIVPDSQGYVSGPGNGGVSSFSDPRSEKYWWKYPRTKNPPSKIFIRNDHGTHWAWEPNGRMKLDEYIANLRATTPDWVKTWS